MHRVVVVGSLTALIAVLVLVVREAPTYLRLDRVKALYDVFEERPAEREAVLRLLDNLRRDPMDEAFVHLERYDFSRHVRTEQVSDFGGTMALDARDIRYARLNGHRERILLDHQQDGDFEFGHFRRFLSTTLDEDDLSLENPVPYVLEGSPEYLSVRGQADYRFRFRPDTLIGDLSARVIEAAPKPELRRKTGIKHVRLYLAPGSGALIGLYVRQRTWSLLFKEESAFSIFLRPDPSGTGWLPQTTRFDTRILAPMADTRRFRVVSTYSDFTPTAADPLGF